MLCPFLSETRVRQCRLAPMRKFIPQVAAPGTELCTSPAFTGCVALPPEDRDNPLPPCPHFQESLMQFCSAAPVTRFVPWSEAALCRCGSDAHHYCDLYLDMTGAASRGDAAEDEVPAPARLHFTTNHMWLDESAEGLCHIGIDAFLARALGPIERIDFITRSGFHRPAATIIAGGSEWQVVFPERVHITSCNANLRTQPERIAGDPYRRGWMFSGTGADRQSLLEGEDAREWMQHECRRMNEFIQAHLHTAADGGLFESGLLTHMPRQQALLLFHEFFLPGTGLTRIP